MATQRKQRSHWYLHFTLFMWHYSTKTSNSEIPVLQMTCRACNIIQPSNFALYLSTERNYISLHMLWFIALCFVCAQRFLLRPLNHIATDGLQLALETHKKSFVKNKVNWQKIFWIQVSHTTKQITWWNKIQWESSCNLNCGETPHQFIMSTGLLFILKLRTRHCPSSPTALCYNPHDCLQAYSIQLTVFSNNYPASARKCNELFGEKSEPLTEFPFITQGVQLLPTPNPRGWILSRSLHSGLNPQKAWRNWNKWPRKMCEPKN